MPLTDHEVEMRQRVTRIESRLCRLAKGLNVQTADPVNLLQVMHETDTLVFISMPVIDTSFSDVIRFLTKEGIEGKVANMYFRNKMVARVYPAEVEHG